MLLVQTHVKAYPRIFCDMAKGNVFLCKHLKFASGGIIATRNLYSIVSACLFLVAHSPGFLSLVTERVYTRLRSGARVSDEREFTL